MNSSTFLLLLLIVSTLTGLVTQGIKVMLTEKKKEYKANTLAGLVAVVLAVMVSIAYVIITGTAITAALFVYLIALALLSWLSAMIGYDKVIQAITQFKKGA